MELNPLELTAAQLDALDRDVERLFHYATSVVPAKVPCKRCGGKGEIKAYSHVLGGICFRCWGVGEEMSQADRAVAAKAARGFKIFA